MNEVSEVELKKAELEYIEFKKEHLRKALENFPLPKQESNNKPVLYIFRHGESEDNENFIFSGWRDSPLTELGRGQASIIADKLKEKDVSVGIHSHLIRSLETLRIAVSKLKKPLKQTLTDDRIIERSYGALQGTSNVELFLSNRILFDKYHRGYDFPPKNGESLKMVEERVFPFCKDLVRKMKKENINVAVAAHGNSMRVIRRYFEKLTIEEMCEIEDPLAQDYCSYVI